MPKRKKKLVNQTQVEEPVEEVVKFIVYAPSGKCPHELKTTRQKDIRTWMTAISEYGLERGFVYTPGAYLYYAQYFYPRFTKEHKKVEKFINKCYIDLGLNEQLTPKEKAEVS